MTPAQRAARMEAALRVALNALHYGHEVCCGGQPGNVFAHALGDVYDLTGMVPPHPGPVEVDAESRAA